MPLYDHQIGQWVARWRGFRSRPITKWHLLDSIVTGHAVTRCGRDMWPSLGGTDRLAIVREPPDGMRCKVCARG